MELLPYAFVGPQACPRERLWSRRQVPIGAFFSCYLTACASFV